MHYIGVDIGGTTIKAGLVDETGKLVEQTRIPTVLDDWPAFFSSLITLIRSLQKTSDVRAIGIGVPSLLNSRTRRIVVSPNIPTLTDVSLENLVSNEVHIPVITENDANAAAYAEYTCGLGSGLLHMACLTDRE
jgi:glucokinase